MCNLKSETRGTEQNQSEFSVFGEGVGMGEFVSYFQHRSVVLLNKPERSLTNTDVINQYRLINTGKGP